jgi:prepilin peptidase CpaA
LGNLNESMILSLLICSLVSLAAFFDLRSHKIPNILTYPSMVLALCYYSSIYGLKGFYFSLAGIGTGIGLLILPYILGGMGAGDAKLLGAVGGFIGAKATVISFVYIALIGCVYAVLLLFVKRKDFKGYFQGLYLTFKLFLMTRNFIPDQPHVQRNRPRVYYGIAIAAGTICYIAFEWTGKQFIDI